MGRHGHPWYFTRRKRWCATIGRKLQFAPREVQDQTAADAWYQAVRSAIDPGWQPPLSRIRPPTTRKRRPATDGRLLQRYELTAINLALFRALSGQRRESLGRLFDRAILTLRHKPARSYLPRRGAKVWWTVQVSQADAAWVAAEAEYRDVPKGAVVEAALSLLTSEP